jgi:hypothetical protein
MEIKLGRTPHSALERLFSGIQFGMDERVRLEFRLENNSALQTARAGLFSCHEFGSRN